MLTQKNLPLMPRRTVSSRSFLAENPELSVDTVVASDKR